MLPPPEVIIDLSSSTITGCPAVVVNNDNTDTLTCMAVVDSNLFNQPNITLTRDGGEIGSISSGVSLTYPLSPSESGVFKCTVCINIPEAGIVNYCGSTVVTISSNGKYIIYSTTTTSTSTTTTSTTTTSTDDDIILSQQYQRQSFLLIIYLVRLRLLLHGVSLIVMIYWNIL